MTQQPQLDSPSPRGARPLRRSALGLLAAAALAACSGCVPLLVGGAVGGAMMANDRRTSGAQIDDEGIELKARQRIREAIGDRGHVDVTSYNRTALVTGEVRDQADKEAVGNAVSGVDNVRSMVNDLVIAPVPPLGERSNDAIITSKVKASLVDARGISATAYKVVTQHGVVYLMGIVTEREANRAVEVARGVNGVRKVVKVFQIISEDELARRQPPAPATEAASTPAR